MLNSLIAFMAVIVPKTNSVSYSGNVWPTALVASSFVTTTPSKVKYPNMSIYEITCGTAVWTAVVDVCGMRHWFVPFSMCLTNDIE